MFNSGLEEILKDSFAEVEKMLNGKKISHESTGAANGCLRNFQRYYPRLEWIQRAGAFTSKQ